MAAVSTRHKRLKIVPGGNKRAADSSRGLSCPSVASVASVAVVNRGVFCADRDAGVEAPYGGSRARVSAE